MTQRQPVNLSVITTPIRGGSYPAGYQIINTSLEATVWVANNPSVAPNAGTPVSPGTSIIWNTDGDLWLVLGADTQSVAAGSASVVLSYDVTAWQPNPIAVATAILNSGVIVIDNPTAFVAPQIVAITGGSDVYGPFDVSRYNSVELYFQSLNALTATNISMQLRWQDSSGNLIADEMIYICALNDSWRASIPILGSRLTVTIFGNTGDGYGISVVASYRQRNSMAQYTPNAFGVLDSDRWAGVPAGQNRVLITPPWFGEIIVNARMIGAGAVAGIGMLDASLPMLNPRNLGSYPMSLNGATIQGDNTTVYQQAFGGSFVSTTLRLGMWGAPIQFTLYNLAAGPIDMEITVTPIRYDA